MLECWVSEVVCVVKTPVCAADACLSVYTQNTAAPDITQLFLTISAGQSQGGGQRCTFSVSK